MDNFDRNVQKTFMRAAEGIAPPLRLERQIQKELFGYCPEFGKRIAILFGGCSPEYGVSLQSAYSVITHLDRKKYTPVLIGISKEGERFQYNGELYKIPADTWSN